MRKIPTKIFQTLLLSFSMLLVSTIAFSQNKVTGKVTDSKDGTPVAGVTVTVKGSKTATQTIADGTFSINVPANGILQFSSVGFARQETSVNGKSNIDIRLAQDNQR